MANGDINNDVEQNGVDIGKYARHPRRTAAGAMLIGTAIGATIMAAKKHSRKTPAQKFMHRFK